MRTYLSWAMALLCMPLLAQQSTDNYFNLPQQPTTVQALLTANSQQHCDSMVTYYEGDIDFVFPNKTVWTYDAQGHVLSQSEYWSSGREHRRWEFTYDNQGHQTSITRFAENENHELVIVRNCEYEYDSNGHVTCETHSHPIGDYNSTIVTEDEESSCDYYYEYDYPEASTGEFRIVYTYDSWGIMTKKIVQVKGVNGSWADSGLKYELDSHGWVWQKSYYLPNGELCRNEYIYDENGKKTSEFYYESFGIDDYLEWIHLISYDATGKRINSTYISWLEEESYWWANKYEYTYDDHNNQTNLVHYVGYCNNESDTWGWWNSYTVDEWWIDYEYMFGKSSYQYDDYGRIVVKTECNYTSGYDPEKHIGTITEYQYDESGNIITETYHDYDSEYDSSHKYEYFYDEFGNLVRQNYYYISNDQWYLSHYDIYYYSNSSEFIEDITKDPLLTTPRKVFKDGKLQIEINGQCFGMDGIRF